MDITKQEKKILLDMFNRCHENKAWAHAERFRVDYDDEIDIVKSLVGKGLIKEVTQRTEYRISFGVFSLIEDPIIDEMLLSMRKIFYAVKAHYKKFIGEEYLIKSLAHDLDFDQEHLVECVLYMKSIVGICGSTDITLEDASYSISPSIMGYKNFDDVIEREYGHWRMNTSVPEDAPKKLLPKQIDKMICQAVAKTLWGVDKSMTIKAMCEHPSVLIHAGGKKYVNKTLRGWFSEIDPRDASEKRGRPKKPKGENK